MVEKSHVQRRFGFEVAPTRVPCTSLGQLVLPYLGILTQAPVFMVKVDAERALCFEAGA